MKALEIYDTIEENYNELLSKKEFHWFKYHKS